MFDNWNGSNLCFNFILAKVSTAVWERGIANSPRHRSLLAFAGDLCLQNLEFIGVYEAFSRW